MNYVYFKKKLGFVSLVVLASSLCAMNAYSMDLQEEKRESTLKRKEHPSEDSNVQKKNRHEDASFSEEEPLTLDYVTALVERAKLHDEDAQAQVVDIRCRGLYERILTPESVGFFSWSNLLKRCYNDDKYAFFCLLEYRDSVIEEKLPNLKFLDLFNSIKIRVNEKNSLAQTILGIMCRRHLGVPAHVDHESGQKNVQKAFKHIKPAADKGLTVAQSNLAEMHFNGEGTAINCAEAVTYYKLAADQGHEASQYKLGKIYYTGLHGIQQDLGEAFKYYKLAADQGHRPSQGKLGFMYHHGQGVQQNFEQAFKYYDLVGDFNNLFVLAENCYSSTAQKDFLMAIGCYASGIKKCSEAWGLGQRLQHPHIAYQKAQNNLKKLVTFVNDDYAANDSENIEIDLSRDLYSKTKLLSLDIMAASMRHSKETFLTKNPDHLSIKELESPYEKLITLGGELEYWGEIITDNLETPGFFITCVQPQELLLRTYKTGCMAEKTAFCLFTMQDNKIYSFIGGKNPKLGANFKHLILKLNNSVKDLEQLEFGLKCSKSTLESITNLNPQMKNNLMNNFLQIDEELVLVSQAKTVIREVWDYLKNLIIKTVNIRNRAFKNENECLFR